MRVVLPELGMGSIAVVAGRWLVARGRCVVQGDGLLEVLAGAATVELPAPASGVLRETLVQPGESLSAGQPLAWIDCDD